MSFRESVSSQLREKFCEFSAKTESFARYLYPSVREVTPGGSTSFFDDGGSLPGLSSLICDRAPLAYPPPESSPFSGGQCPTVYQWSLKFSGVRENGATYTDSNFDPFFSSANTILGPVGEPFIDQADGFWKVVDGNGDSVPLRTANGVVEVTRREWAVQRNDGMADDCGDPPPVPLPPFEGNDNKYDINISFEGPDGTPIDLPSDLTFLIPILKVDGNLSIPFQIENLEFKLEGEFNLSTGDISFNFGGRSDNEKCCLPPGTDGNPPETPDDPQEEPGENRSIIIGAIVTSQIVGDLGNLSQYGQGEGPDLFHTRLGNVYFVVLINERRIWTPAIEIRHQQLYVPCPAGFPAVDVVGYFRQGVAHTITPVYDKVQTPNPPT